MHWKPEACQHQIICVLIGAGLLLSGCAGTPEQWMDPAPRLSSWTELPGAWPNALKQFEKADTADAVQTVIEGLGAWVDAGHADPALLTTLAEAHTLYGAAWADGRAEKRHHFSRARQLSQAALVGHAEFAEALATGSTPAEAAELLPREAVPAMVAWVTATAYRFEETMGPLQRARNFRQMETVRRFMERAIELDPEYEYGVVPFSLAIYHIATPTFAGGDRELAGKLLEQAIATPGVSLLPQWGRARYLYPITRDTEARRRDLEWILAQDPRAVDSAYRWNVYLQADARRMLDQMR